MHDRTRSKVKSREPRRKVSVDARMRSGTHWINVCIRNISSRGALVQTALPPTPGTYVEIRRADQILIGRSVWRDGQHFGVRTQDRVDISAIVDDGSAPRAVVPKEAELRPDRHGEAQAREDDATGIRLERSRHLARAMQFAAIAMVAAAVAALGAAAIYDVLGRPLGVIESHLRLGG